MAVRLSPTYAPSSIRADYGLLPSITRNMCRRSGAVTTGSITAPEDALKKRYADLAECYRMLAEERKRLVGSGAAPTTPGDISLHEPSPKSS